MVQAIAYIDGFNLYHGMKQSFGRRYHWLDLEAMVSGLLRPDQTLRTVKLFTARVRGNLAAEHRQDRYLQALAAHCLRIEIVEGRFQKKQVRCRLCGAEWLLYEEKESDVNLAVALVEDAAKAEYDIAFVISADSDLGPAVRAARRLRPATRVIGVFPPGRQSTALRRTFGDLLNVDRAMLSRSQLPDTVVTPAGIKLVRPAHWT